jgi:RNA polymerase sigma factor (sigma-70 family)
MPTPHAALLLRHIHQLVAAPAEAVPDRELLKRFGQRREEEAFAALLRRHGPMVLRVCRRVLPREADAEDAFQATFLSLARHGHTIRSHTALAGWLYQVAWHAAHRIRIAAARRSRYEREAPIRATSDPLADMTAREMLTALDEALHRLPAKYRDPLVLCYLEGLAREEAARQLGCPLGTLKGRLERGKELLRAALERRGQSLSAALATAVVGYRSADAAVPGVLTRTTLCAAMLTTPAAVGLTMANVAAACFVLVLVTAGAVGWVESSRPTEAPRFALAAGEASAKRGASVGLVDSTHPTKRTDAFGDPLPQGAIARLGTIRFRPGGYVNSLAFTPDGKRLVSHGYWSGVNVWDDATGKELRRFMPNPEEWVGAALLTPDGQAVVTLESVNQKHTIRVRDLAELKVTREFGIEYMHSPRLTPDGKLLIGIGGNGNDVTLEFWNFETGQHVRTLKAHKGHVWAIELSADGKTLATGGMDKTIRLWDVSAGTLLREIDGSPNVISKLALSRDGSLVASLGSTEIKHGAASSFPWENRIRLWDVATGKELRQLKTDAKNGRDSEPPAFSMVAFTPDGKTLLTAGNDGVCRLWDAATGKEQRQVPLGNRGLVTLAFSADSKSVAVAGSSIRLLDLATGKDKLLALGPAHAVAAVPVTPDGHTAATINEGFIQLWDATTGRPKDRIGAAVHDIAALTASADGHTVFSLGGDRTLRLWDLRSGKERRRFDVPDIVAGPEKGAAVRALSSGVLGAVTPDAATAVVVNADKSLRVLDLATGKERLKLPASEEWVYSTGLSPDGRTLIVCHGDHTAHVWDVDSGKELRKFEFAEPSQPAPVAPVPVGGKPGKHNWAYAASISPDGRLIAYGSQTNYLAIHDVATGKAIHLIENLTPDGAGTFGFSPDSRMLAWSGWRQSTIHLLELATGKERRSFDGHKGRVTSLAFSADGRTLISGSEDTTGLVWDVFDTRAAKESLTDDDQEATWVDLGSDDAGLAFRALGKLISVPKEGVAMLHKHLSPITAPDARRLATLIADLDSDKFAVRNAAMKELANLGELAAPVLREALDKTASTEARRRIESLLAKLKDEGATGESMRQARAMEALERIATPEARQLLTKLAAGAAGARQTREAKATLARLQSPRR